MGAIKIVVCIVLLDTCETTNYHILFLSPVQHVPDTWFRF